MGIAGGPIEGVKMRLREIPELGFLVKDPLPKGEICIKTPSMFEGYLNDEERTKEAFDEEGWF